MYLERGNSIRQIARVAGVVDTVIARRIRKLTKRLLDGEYITCLRNQSKFTKTELAIAKDYFLLGLSIKTVAAKHRVTYYRARETVRKIRRLIAAIQQQNLRPPFDWPLSTPAEQGLESDIFAHAFNEAEKIPNLASLLVVRNGFLIFEGYFHLKNKLDALNVYSVSKSFTSALVGIAIREGFISSLDQKVLDFFPDYASSINDPRKYDLTLRHLISMKAGWDFQEELIDYIAYFSAPDRIRYLLELPLLTDPGTEYDYDSGQTDLLSVILSRATGMLTKDFAELYLFTPLSISIRYWEPLQPGYQTGGYGMYFTPRDMARFGWLFLKKGNLDGRQIIPEDWVEETTREDTPFISTYGVLTDQAYGYGWWLAKMGGYDVTHAAGHYGQRILLFPELNTVVVTSVEPAGIWGSPYSYDVLNVVLNTIIRPIRNFLGDPPYSPRHPKVVRREDRSLLQKRYIDILGWQPNLRNSNANIACYRIYRIHDRQVRQFLGEVPAGTLEFQNPNIYEKLRCTYGITAITSEGQESLPVAISIQYPSK